MVSRPFFFFKQKTAYEITVRDWSSDVCSSDLGRQASDLGAKRVEATRAHDVVAVLADDKGALPIIAPIERDEQMAEIDEAAGLLRIVRPPRQAHPQHIHRRAEICHRETRSLAHGRVTPIGADDEVGADLDRATRAVGAQPDNAIALEDQIV